MKRSGDIRWGELRLGLLIFVALGLLLWASIQGGASLFKKEARLYASFPNVQGVVAGAPIWFQGVEVGTVDRLGFHARGDSSQVLVSLRVNQEIMPWVRRDSRVRIQALNVFGEKFMELTPGTRGAPQANDGDTLRSEPPTDIAQMLARADGLVTTLDSTLTDLKIVMGRVRRGEGTLGRLAASDGLYDELERMVHDSRVLAGRLDASQGEMRTSLVATLGTLDSLMTRVERGEGTLGRLSKDPALYDHMAGASARMDSALARVERGEGNLGRLSQDEELYRNLEQSLARLNGLLTDIQANPKKYFKFSVF
jgi:phospholipid/cholesterol/gamma-HCH transport system substrate-binding protein